MKRVYNFSAGPAVLPEPVLQQAAAEMLDYQGSGMSVMEMSHRSKVYKKIIDEAEADLRTLLKVPSNYKILFLQGGGTTQFAMVAMNLMTTGVADYIITGQWAKKAFQEAKIYGTPNVIASSEDKNFSEIPDLKNLQYTPEASYVFMCENNTIFGTKFKEYPDTKGKILVNDASSCFLSEPLDVTKFGLIFAGAQKNVGPAGVTIVIIREDLLEISPRDYTPTLLKYKIHADHGSMYNTPPAYAIYICGLVFKYLLNLGGLEAVKANNEKKAAILYDYLDTSKLFKGSVKKSSRSLMNVCFRTNSPELDVAFIEGAKKAGFSNLAGHRSTGGMRASIYNSMPLAGVQALVDYMKEFEAEHLK
ncbi:MAG: 3-phosphoserine/phosphohydroxythreonine transaminase [Bacilli bacterium]|jgi:phosphoserine aminotransferase